MKQYICHHDAMLSIALWGSYKAHNECCMVLHQLHDQLQALATLATEIAIIHRATQQWICVPCWNKLLQQAVQTCKRDSTQYSTYLPKDQSTAYTQSAQHVIADQTRWHGCSSPYAAPLCSYVILFELLWHGLHSVFMLILLLRYMIITVG